MSRGSAERAIIDIQLMLDGLPCTPSRPSIHRVGTHFRSGGQDHIYDPEVLSIGPYHQYNPRLQHMEQHKLWYLKRLLKRKNEQSVDRYVTAVAAMEKCARKCYAEPVNLDEYAFVTLLVLDGIFLVELFRFYGLENLRDVDDPILRHHRFRDSLRHDILLVENQIPFFVLNELFNMTKTNINENEHLVKLALRFVECPFLGSRQSVSRVWEEQPLNNIDHLCGLLHCYCFIPFEKTLISSNGYETREVGSKWDNIQSISRLREAGIEFRKAKLNEHLMGIKFSNGALMIPELSIFDDTESQFRNLIVHEQYLPDWEQRYFSDYSFFMHCLIKTSNDVEFLRSRGIIKNFLGPDEEVCLMFNRLGRNAMISCDFCYSRVFCSVNSQCLRWGRKWKASLKRNYFNSPWTIISFLAAALLLLLTFAQTAYTILSYYNRGT